MRHCNKRDTVNVLGKHYTFSDLRHSVALEFIKKGDEEKALEYLRNKRIAQMRQFYKRAGYNYLKQDK